jgi:hypothetical protein
VPKEGFQPSKQNWLPLRVVIEFPMVSYSVAPAKESVVTATVKGPFTVEGAIKHRKAPRASLAGFVVVVFLVREMAVPLIVAAQGIITPSPRPSKAAAAAVVDASSTAVMAALTEITVVSLSQIVLPS